MQERSTQNRKEFSYRGAKCIEQEAPSIYLPCRRRRRAVAGGGPCARNHAFHGSPTVSAIKQQHQQQHLATQPPSRIRLPRAGKEGHATQQIPIAKKHTTKEREPNHPRSGFKAEEENETYQQMGKSHS